MESSSPAVILLDAGDSAIVTAGSEPRISSLISGALRILRLTATRLYLLDPGMPLWRVPLLP